MKMSVSQGSKLWGCQVRNGQTITCQFSLTALPSVYSEWRTEGTVRYNQWNRAIDAKKNNM